MAPYTSPTTDYMETEDDLTILPENLWSRTYLTLGPGVLSIATRRNPTRVAEIFADPENSPPLNRNLDAPVLNTFNSAPRPAPPRITPYDGTPENLRAFCSQLINQIQESSYHFSDEMSKVRFAYQCLGPGAVTKMRSCFRCLEDPTVAPEITTLAQFIAMLRQNCEDPARLEKASQIAETLYQGSMTFHEFITIFEDNLADSTYADLDKSQWKAMLKRRLSSDLRRALLSAYNVPEEYHAFVGYLRAIDAEIQSIRATKRPKITPPVPQLPRFNRPPHISAPYPNLSSISERTVSQGGSAMDLDAVSKEKDQDGRLTLQAKNARRTLGRCLWCNKSGHLVSNCPRGSRTLAASTIEPSTTDDLKVKLQQ